MSTNPRLQNQFFFEFSNSLPCLQLYDECIRMSVSLGHQALAIRYRVLSHVFKQGSCLHSSYYYYYIFIFHISSKISRQRWWDCVNTGVNKDPEIAISDSFDFRTKVD